MIGPQRCSLDVFLLLTQNDHVLLALRKGTGFADGMWNLPSGKAEGDESAVGAVIREAHEELGIQLSEDEISYAATVHCRNSDTDIRIGLFFQAAAKDTPLDIPYNAEPHKCAKIAWHPMTMLPSSTMPYSALGVSLYRRKAHFGTTGWQAPGRPGPHGRPGVPGGRFPPVGKSASLRRRRSGGR